MNKFPSLNRRSRGRLIWPCLSAAIGCLILANASAQNAAPVVAEAASSSPTYLRDIQPIFMGNCSRCHNQQSHFVYNWLDYQTAYADRWEIRRRVWDSWQGSYYKEAMPIANSPESLALSDEERLTIRNWVDSGAPKGVASVGRRRKIENRAHPTGPAAVHLHLRRVSPAHRPGACRMCFPRWPVRTI